MPNPKLPRQLVPLEEECLRRLGRRGAPATRWRWVREGRRGIRLPATLVLGKWHVDPEDFEAWLRAVTDAALGRGRDPPQEGRDEQTEQRLRGAGLL